MKQIYKNLYFNEEEGTYEFIDENNRKQVVTEQSYLLIYLLEVILESQKNGGIPFLSNEKT